MHTHARVPCPRSYGPRGRPGWYRKKKPNLFYMHLPVDDLGWPGQLETQLERTSDFTPLPPSSSHPTSTPSPPPVLSSITHMHIRTVHRPDQPSNLNRAAVLSLASVDVNDNHDAGPKRRHHAPSQHTGNPSGPVGSFEGVPRCIMGLAEKLRGRGLRHAARSEVALECHSVAAPDHWHTNLAPRPWSWPVPSRAPLSR